MAEKPLQISFLDKAIGWISPQHAVKRHAARLMLEVLGKRQAFDPAGGTRLRADWVNITQDADSANSQDLEGTRNYVRQLTRQNGLVAGPLKRIANNVIGHGIRPEAAVQADGEIDSPKDPRYAITEEVARKFNHQAEKLWKAFIRKADSTLQLNFYELQKLAFRATFADGEILAVARSSSNYGRIIPLCIELVEIDRLWTPNEFRTDENVRNGIRFTDEGVPEKYYVLKRHPGSNRIPKGLKGAMDYEELNAFDKGTGTRNVIHLYDMLRPGQSRGYSAFAPAVTDFQDVHRIKEAEVVGTRIAACLAAFVKSPSALQQVTGLPTNQAGDRLKEFQPGMIEYLRPGEEIEIHNPNRPNTGIREFVSFILSICANAADMPYEVFSGDWRGLNYSNARTILLQAYLSFRIYQNLMVEHFCAPIWEHFISECIAAGLLDAPGFAFRRDDYLRATWIAPGWQWVDPVKEAQGKQIELDNLFDTLTDICAATGKDFQEVAETRAKELQLIKDLEEKYGIQFKQAPPGPGQGKNQSKEETKDEQE